MWQSDGSFGLRLTIPQGAETMSSPDTRDRPADQTGHSTERQRPLVLLADDCVESRAMYAEYLQPEYRVAEAGSGAEAIEKTLALTPAIVVLDLTLPDIDGAEASQRIKRDERTRCIPVLIVSGHDEPKNGSAPPWDAYLRKPCRPDVLATHIRKALEARLQG